MIDCIWNYCFQSCCRKSSGFLKNLALSRSHSYEKIFQATSRRPMHYDQNNIYMGDFSSQQSVGCGTISKKRFERAPFTHNIEDYLFVQAPHPTACDQCRILHCCKPSLLALSTRNSLSKLLGECLSYQFIDLLHNSDAIYIEQQVPAKTENCFLYHFKHKFCRTGKCFKAKETIVFSWEIGLYSKTLTLHYSSELISNLVLSAGGLDDIAGMKRAFICRLMLMINYKRTYWLIFI